MDDLAALAERFRRYAAAGGASRDDRAGSPLCARIAQAVSESDDALRAIDSVPPRRRHPALILAALHDLALAKRAPALATAYAAGHPAAAAAAAIDTLILQAESIGQIVERRRVCADETGRHAVLYPAIAEASRSSRAPTVGLIDVGRSAGFNLLVDRAGIEYSTGQRLGVPSSPVQQSCRMVGEGTVPDRTMPPVAARVALHPDQLNASDADDARWLRANVPPDQPEQAARLDAEIALAAAATPPLLRLRGEGTDLLPAAIGLIPADALPVVITTWTLSRRSPAGRARFVQQLAESASDRPVAWVSVEGVGVAPTIPTLGDRPASGHSIIGLTLFGDGAPRVAAVGRCWSRGRLMSWLAHTVANTT